MPPVRHSLLALVLLCSAACRQSSSSAVSSSEPLPPSSFGSNGCAGPSQLFQPGQRASAVALGTLNIGPRSQLASARDAELLYATGLEGSVVAIDVSGESPVESLLVQPGTVEALIGPLGFAGQGELGGLCVLDADTLLVIEHTTHVLLAVDRNTPDTVSVYAGLPSALGGFADGLAQLARFSFTQSTQVIATGDGRVFVADPGNHALRAIEAGVVATVAGSGAPGFLDGELATALFDTPTGLVVDCADHLLVSELGLEGFGGQRIRELSIGPNTFFGQLGSALTLLGDGSAATVAGVGGAAQLAEPCAPVLSAEGELYWVDRMTGVLRRALDPASSADCPLFADCDAAQLAPTFTPGGDVSLALTPGGVLWALDVGALALLRITP